MVDDSSLDVHKDCSPPDQNSRLSELLNDKKPFRVSFLNADSVSAEFLDRELTNAGISTECFLDLGRIVGSLEVDCPGATIVFPQRVSDAFQKVVLRLRERVPRQPVILVASPANLSSATEAFHLGASDLLVRPFGNDALLSAIVRAYREWYQMNTEEREKSRQQYYDGLDRFSDRENQIFYRMIGGLTSPQIAEQIGLTAKSVEKYRVSIRDKMRIDNFGELLRLWRVSQLLERSL